MARFVVLKHETPAGAARPSHWDFMVEMDGALRTWALAEAPTANREIAAERLADHRLAYLDYEGPISGDRGSVTRWDQGECTVEVTTANTLRLKLHGSKLVGSVEIVSAEHANAIFLWRSPAPDA